MQAASISRPVKVAAPPFLGLEAGGTRPRPRHPARPWQRFEERLSFFETDPGPSISQRTGPKDRGGRDRIFSAALPHQASSLESYLPIPSDAKMPGYAYADRFHFPAISQRAGGGAIRQGRPFPR